MKRLHIIIILLFLGMLPGLLLGQRKNYHQVSHRDTVQCSGQTFVLSIGNCCCEMEHCRELGIARIAPGPRKWVKTLSLDQFVGDCNSVRYQLSNYVVGPNSITLYTAYTFEGQLSMAPVGVRKQVWEFTPNGQLKLVNSQVNVNDNVPCHDHATYMDIAKESNPNATSADGWRLYHKCYQDEFNASPVSGKDAAQLRWEVLLQLNPRMEDLYKHAIYPIHRIR